MGLEKKLNELKKFSFFFFNKHKGYIRGSLITSVIFLGLGIYVLKTYNKSLDNLTKLYEELDKKYKSLDKEFEEQREYYQRIQESQEAIISNLKYGECKRISENYEELKGQYGKMFAECKK